MKRKKQREDPDSGRGIEPNRKRARPESTALPISEHGDTSDELHTTPLKKKSSRRGVDTVKNGSGPTILQRKLGEDGVIDSELADGITETEIEVLAGPVDITPIKRGRGRPPKSASKTQTSGTTPRKGLTSNKLFSTPVKTNGNADADGTPKLERNADRSARRKSTRTLIERTVQGNASDQDDDEEDIANHIYDSGEEDDLAQDETELESETSEMAKVPETPSKRGRGRPKGSKNRQRSPSPLRNLPPHEMYFSQNRGGRSKTSNNNLSSLALLDHEEYFSLAREFEDPHADDIEFLQDLHSSSFNQWQFELSQGFNICLYGWGSKKSLLMRFAEQMYQTQTENVNNKTIVVNGYVHNLTIRDILNTIAVAISERGQKLGSQPAEMLESLTSLLEEDTARSITLIIHSIDRAPLRRPANQIILSRLSSHPQIHLVASADHPSFPLLWDSSLRSTYNFLFHDCTTFQPYKAEVDVVDEVHELLGRSGKRIGGKEGVTFVLKSLPENAKNLFRVLIGEQLATMDDSWGVRGWGGDEDDNDDETERLAGNHRTNEPGVEYKVLYQKAVEEFICSNEMNFRTLLKEFHDHQMIQSRKDVLGTEILSVPFRKEELESILEDTVP